MNATPTEAAGHSGGVRWRYYAVPSKRAVFSNCRRSKRHVAYILDDLLVPMLMQPLHGIGESSAREPHRKAGRDELREACTGQPTREPRAGGCDVARLGGHLLSFRLPSHDPWVRAEWTPVGALIPGGER